MKASTRSINRDINYVNATLRSKHRFVGRQKIEKQKHGSLDLSTAYSKPTENISSEKFPLSGSVLASYHQLHLNIFVFVDEILNQQISSIPIFKYVSLILSNELDYLLSLNTFNNVTFIKCLKEIIRIIYNQKFLTNTKLHLIFNELSTLFTSTIAFSSICPKEQNILNIHFNRSKIKFVADSIILLDL